MKLFLDQGTPLSSASMFRSAGVDAVHATELGMARAPDHEIVARAHAEGRIVVSFDRDFPQLLALTRAASPSVIMVRRQGLRAHDFFVLISEVLRDFGSWLAQGGIVSIGKTRPRFRRLPIR